MTVLIEWRTDLEGIYREEKRYRRYDAKFKERPARKLAGTRKGARHCERRFDETSARSADAQATPCSAKKPALNLVTEKPIFATVEKVGAASHDH